MPEISAAIAVGPPRTKIGSTVNPWSLKNPLAVAMRNGSCAFHDKLTKAMRRFFFSCADPVHGRSRPPQRIANSAPRNNNRIIGCALLFDFDDRCADAIDGSLAVRGQIVAPWRVEVADVGGALDKNHRSGKLKGAFAAVLLHVEHAAVGLHQDDGVSFIGRDPKITLGIEGWAVGAFEQRALGHQRRLCGSAIAADGEFPSLAARGVGDVERCSFFIKYNYLGDGRLIMLDYR